MNSLISVIVPIYNVEKYLDKCVDSIINQTYKNLEIILVDDGSPDNCPKMCDDYAKKDSRIKVVHKENGGLSDARNAGMKVATGEYVSFIDSDDWIDLETFSISMAKIEECNAQIVAFNIINVATNITQYNNYNGTSITINDVNKEWCDRWIDGRSSPIIHIKDPANTSIKFNTAYDIVCNDIEIRPELNKIVFDGVTGTIKCKKLVRAQVY